MAAYRTPDERFEDLAGWPFPARYVEQDGLRMHYVEEGTGDPVLLIHGEPTWGFLYRTMIPTIAEVGRVVAPDLFGFGRSDKPLDPAAYSYDAHFRSVERLALELELERLTLVVHDWGGPIGLRFAVTHPDRVSRVVILNSGVGVGAPSEPWLRFRALVREVGRDLVASRLVQASCVSPLGEDAVRGYDAPFPVGDAKTGALAFPELVPTEPDHPSAAAMLAGARRALPLGGADARPVLGLRPRLLARPRRAPRRPHPGSAAGRDRPGRGALPPGGQGPGDRRADRPLRDRIDGELYSIGGRKVASPRSGGAP